MAKDDKTSSDGKLSPKSQKLLIESLLSEGDLLARCINILKSEYFAPEYRQAIAFVLNYFDDYNSSPSFTVMNSKFDPIEFKPNTTISPSEIEYFSTEIEAFCKQKAFHLAFLDSFPLVEEGNFGGAMERIKEALLVSLPKDLGIDFFQDIEGRLTRYKETEVAYSTGIASIDKHIDGGLRRKQFLLFSANSGGGKSIMMTNFALNYAMDQHVLLISLELPEEMVDVRSLAIAAGHEANKWREDEGKIIDFVNQMAKQSQGSFIIKRMKNGSTANDITSYLKFYQLKHKRSPDLIIIDYLDCMSPNQGTKNLSISEQDKKKSEEVAEILNDFNMMGISASQQNREGLRMASPDQAVIAGGFSKINAVDIYISLYMSPEMRLVGDMFAYFLKTRSSDGVGKMERLKFNSANLRITDEGVVRRKFVLPQPKHLRAEEESAASEDDGDDSPIQSGEFSYISDHIEEVAKKYPELEAEFTDLFAPHVSMPFYEGAVENPDDEIDAIGFKPKRSEPQANNNHSSILDFIEGVQNV